jgi:protein-S-isoprenylcysteine O-methyltransferase Ste14
MDSPSKVWVPHNIGPQHDSHDRPGGYSGAVNVFTMTSRRDRGAAWRIKAMFALKLIFGVAFQLGLFGLLLFLPAQTLDWPRAWVLLGGMAAGTAAAMLCLRDRPDLINERLKGPIQKGQPLADKIVTNLLLAMLCGVVAFIPLDVFHFHLLGGPGVLVSVLGLGLIVVGFWIAILAMRENAFAVGVVKYQQERHHQVIDRGVYAKVRHPMYAGGILFIVGICLWLGSYAAAVLALIPIGTLVLRMLIEEHFLRHQLDGYKAYTERTRYRLIPFLW